MPDQPTPVRPSNRIHSIDMLRGFALLGILLVNMAFFNNSIYYGAIGFPEATSFPDQLSRWFISFFAEGKFYSMFSFLFGLGLAIQFQRATAKNIPFVGTYARRLLILLLIGLIHAYLFWVGDILVLYALLGFLILLFFRNVRPRTTLIWAGICLAIPLLLNVGLWGLIELGRLAPEGAAMIEEMFDGEIANYLALAQESDRIYATGTFGEVTRQRVQELNFMYSIMPFSAFNVLITMLLGLYVGQRRIFEDIEGHLPLIRRTFWWGLLIGVIGNLIYVVAKEFGSPAVPSFYTTLTALGQTIGAPALSLFYMSGIVLLVRDEAWHGRLLPLASAGRMAMTNYLMQTVICTTLFFGYGLGFYGIGATAGLALTIVIYLLQIAWSVWWLQRFRFGPMEWLWRSLTYMKRQPMARS